MYTKKSSFPFINVIVSLSLLAWVSWKTYNVFLGSYKLATYVLFTLSFDFICGVLVLLLALSIGKSDREPERNYKPLIGFNVFMLAAYGIFLIAFHVVLVIKILKWVGIM